MTAGAAAIIIAVVGGGAKAFGVDVPVLKSVPRQIALALVGVAFLGAAIVLREDGASGSDSAANREVQDYRQEVRATCRSLPRGEPSPTADLTFDRTAYLDFFIRQRQAWQGIFADLWERTPPDTLKDEKAEAERTWNRLFNQWGVALERLRNELAPRFDIQVAQQAANEMNSALAAPATALEREMSRLAGAPCTRVAASAGG